MRRGAVVIALVTAVLLLAGGAAWMALRDAPSGGTGDAAVAPDGSGRPTEPSPPVPSAEEEAVRRRVAEPAPAAPDDERPEGAIRVVDADGRPADVWLSTTDDRAFSADRSMRLGRTQGDGLLRADEREAEPRAFLWAVRRGAIAGPVPCESGGQTLVLGDGAVVEVHLRGPDGAPVAGAFCEGSPFGMVQVTDEQGVARLAGFPPDFDVRVRAGAVGRSEPARAEVHTPPDGTASRVDLEVDPGPGPFLMVAIDGDVPPGREIRLDLDLGGAHDDRDVSLRLFGTGPPLRVGLGAFASGTPLTVRARSVGTRTASADTVVPERGATGRVDLTLAAGGVPARGRVLRADGTPAADASVGPRDDVLGWGAETTDAGGWFDVRSSWVGEEILAIRESESCSAPVRLDGDLAELVLRLAPGATIAGTVRDETSGRPVVAATVELRLGPEEHDRTWSAETDAAGAYRFAGLPAGTWVLPLVDDTPRARATAEQRARLDRAGDGWSPARLLREGHAHVIEGSEAVEHDLVAVAQRGGDCTFRFVVPDGAELPESLTVEHTLTSPTTLRNGRSFARLADGDPHFTLFLEEGTHRLRFLAPGLAGAAPEIVVSGDGTLPDVEVRLAPRRRILARLVDADGAPVAREGVAVRLAVRGPNGGRSQGEGRTDAAGTADLTDEAPAPDAVDSEGQAVVLTLSGDGVYTASAWGARVNLSVPGPEWARRAREESGEPWVLDVPLLVAAAIPVNVVDADGRPVPGVPVRWKTWSDRDWTETVSDARGVVTLEPESEASSFELQATGEWIGAEEVHGFDMGREDAQVRLRVDRRRTVRVRLVDASGAALPSREVWIHGVGDDVRATTDEDGVVEVDCRAGDATISLDVRDHWTPRKLEVPAGAAQVDALVEALFPVRFHADLPAELARPERVDFRAGEPSGLRAWASVETAPGEPVGVTLDVPRRALPVHVSVGHPWYEGTATYTGAEDDVTVRVERLPGRDVMLALVGDDRKPLAGLAVRIAARGDTRILDTRAVTDAAGRVTVTIPPQPAQFVVEAEGRRSGYWSYSPDRPPEDPEEVRLPSAR